MYISSLSLANFRNYTSEKIEFSPYTNVIYGDNAQAVSYTHLTLPTIA